MTTKEIADFCEVSTKTVRRWITKLPAEKDKMMSAGEHGETVDWDQESVYLILESGGRGAIARWMRACQNNTPSPDKMAMSSERPESDIDMAFKSAIITLTGLAQNFEMRLSKIENRVEERQMLLPAPSLEPREHINMIVREYAHKHEISYAHAWGELYRQFTYRTNTNPAICAKNRGMSILDYIETEGMIETLEAIAVDTLI